MKKTTIILSTLLTASIIGNAVQYNKAPGGTATTIATQPVTDEPEEEATPPTATPQESQEGILRWDVYATFAVTYKVDHKPGLVGGYTVTIYYIDANPTVIRKKDKPGLEAVTWAPELEGLPGVVEVKAVAVKARRFSPKN